MGDVADSAMKLQERLRAQYRRGDASSTRIA
jgi:hypothetical protein